MRKTLQPDPMCKHCRFWVGFDKRFDDEKELTIGACHRYPPPLDAFAMQKAESIDRYCHPRTLSTDWCGEWQRQG